MQRNRSNYKISKAPTGGDPANIYLFKFNNRNTRKRSEICSKLTIKTAENVSWRAVLENFDTCLFAFHQNGHK